MRKVIILIIIVCGLSIGGFIWYMSSGIDRNEVYYKTLVTHSEVVYKTVNNKELTYDILMPETVKHEKIPVVFFVHGGSFVSGDKMDLTDGVRRYVVEGILEEGYAIISINYRNLDETTHFPSNIIDVKDAIRYTTQISEQYNLDPDNYGIWGVGAGAYLALTVAYTPSGLFYGDYNLREYSADVQYIIDMAGVTNIATTRDITQMTPQELADAQAELDTLYGLGMDIYNLSETDYDDMAQFDPISYISDDSIPTFIMHGVNDELVSLTQSDILELKLIEYSIVYEYHKIIGGDHDLNDLAVSERENVTGKVIYFILSNYNEAN